MAVSTYFTRIGKRVTDVLALVMSAGAADAGKIAALDETGRWHPSLMPAGIVADVTVLPASEALGPRSQVNIWDDGGTKKVRYADASNGRKSDGFVIDAVALGAQATVYHDAPLEGFTDLVVDETYVLSDTTPGGISITAVTRGVGKIHQVVGFAATDTKLICRPDSNPVYFA